MIEMLADLREWGWLVASHNEYVVDATGEIRVYWSFTKGHMFTDGDGSTDVDAVRQCWTYVANLPIMHHPV